MLEDRRYAKSTYKANLYAIKFLYKRTLGRKWETLDITRVKNDRKLPEVLSREEVWDLLALVRKESVLICLTLMYTCGLRVSEAVNLRIKDIDSKRMVLWVRNSKGNKDRSVPLPVQTLTQLRAYWLNHRSKMWLFPGKVGPMNIATVQHCFKATVEQRPTLKKVSCPPSPVRTRTIRSFETTFDQRESSRTPAIVSRPGKWISLNASQLSDTTPVSVRARTPCSDHRTDRATIFRPAPVTTRPG